MSTLTDEEIKQKCLGNLRIVRNSLLNRTDKYATLDFPHTSETKKQEWFAYRTALRNLPSTCISQGIVLDADLTNVTWPTPPS